MMHAQRCITGQAVTRISHPLTTIWSTEFRKVPDYPPHPPMPASRHRAQAGHIPVDCQSQEHSGTAVN